MLNSWRAFILVMIGVGLYVVAIVFDYPLLKVDSDTLYLPVLFKDVIDGSGHIEDWYLSPAPYFFPDFLLFWLAYSVTDNVIWQMIVFGSLQVCALWWVGGYCLRNLDVVRADLVSALSVLALISMSIYGINTYSLLFVSVHHIGVLLIGILVLGLCLDIVKSSHGLNRLAKIGLVFILFILTNLSDRIFLAQFVGPIVADALLIAILDKEKRAIWIVLAGALLVGAVIGSWSYGWLVTHPTRYGININWRLVVRNWPSLLKSLQDFYFTYTILTVILLVSNLIILVNFGLCLIKKHIGMAFVLGVVLLSFFMVCLGLLVSDIVDFPIRYFIPSLFLPVFFIFSVISWTNLVQHDRYYVAIAVCLLVSISSVFYYRYNEITPIYNTELECIDSAVAENKLHYGIAQYWDAKFLQSMLKNPIALSQVNTNLGSFFWITSEKFYQSSYDFAIISNNAEPNYKIRADLIKHINGEPTKIVSCGQRDILIYPSGKLYVEKFSSAGKSFVWRGCELPTQVGNYIEQCHVQSQNKSGMLTFGPRERLHPGLYKATIHYRSSAAVTQKVSDWGVVLYRENKSPTILGQGALVGTDNILSEVVGQFQITQSGFIDVPTIVQPNQTVILEALTIERLQ